MTNTIIFSLYYPFLFSLVLPKVINLFKKNVHSFFSFTTTPHHSISGLGLITTDVDRPPNVLESSMLRPNNNNNNNNNNSISSLSTSLASTNNNKVIGFVDDVGGGGLVSCTESLGFESSDEIHNKNNGDDNDNKKHDDDEIWRRRMMRAEGRGNWKKVRSFPPPLSSLNRNGKPNFYLRPVRKDGRLELTEVRIQRSEILHASRHNGRLTLRLVPEQNVLEDKVDEEEEEEKLEVIEEEEIRYEKEEEEERVGEWTGLRRCHEMVNQHHHHHHHHHHVHGNLRMCGIGIV